MHYTKPDGHFKTYIIVLNYNNWPDTIECLESLFSLEGDSFKIVVCDNGSEDNSLTEIRQWAEGQSTQSTLHKTIPGANNNRVQKPIKCLIIDPDSICNNLNPENISERLILIDNKKNLGFSGGNNVGIRFSLLDRSVQYIWILNNDTIADRLALVNLIKKMESNPNIGASGSTIIYYHDTEKIQALGGFKFNKFLGLSKQIGHLKTATTSSFSESDVRKVEKSMFGIQGASIFVRKIFLDKIGLLPEDYFLYFEEEDWAMKSIGHFQFGYSPDSVVYHKEGKSTGSNSFKETTKPLSSEFYLTMSRLIFTQKYFPLYLPGICFSHLMIATKRLLHGNWKNSVVVLVSTFFFITSGKQRSLTRNDADSYHHFMERLLHTPLLNLIGEKLFIKKH